MALPAEKICGIRRTAQDAGKKRLFKIPYALYLEPSAFLECTDEDGSD